MKQSQTFKFLGLICKRNGFSSTQSCISIFTPDGRKLTSFDGSAKFDRKSLTHSAFDGRANPWQVTDEEFKDSLQRSLHSTMPIYEPEIYKLLKAAISHVLRKRPLNSIHQ